MTTLTHDPLDTTFNLTIEEVRILAKYRALSRHQQRGILQAIELIRPAGQQEPARAAASVEQRP